jgi:DNA helicase-2/ATP-dependent DNA helicase PcrA
LLPHSRSIDRPQDVEEERRLFYVGMTRAKESLVISRAIYRRSYGEERLRASLPSRFLSEIPSELLETVPGSISELGETRRYEADPEYSEYCASRGRRTGSAKPAYGRTARAARASKNPMIGTRVRHPKYGIGTILDVEGEGEDRKLTVSFEDYGAKKLLERYANLQLA